MCKTLRTQNFRPPRFSWYSFADICRPFQPSHLKNHEFHYFTKLPTKQSSYAWCTDNLAMCKPLRTQNFRAPRISWYSFGDIFRPFQPSHLKNHEFHFFTKLPPSHMAMPLCTDQIGHVQNPSNLKISCTKTFTVLIWGYCRPFQSSHLKNHEFYFFTKHPTKPSCYVVVHRNLGPVQNPPNSKLSFTKNLVVFIWGHF